MRFGYARNRFWAAALEGARYTFCHLGKNVTLEVRNGVTREKR